MKTVSKRNASGEHTPFNNRGPGGQLLEDGPKRHPNKGRKAPVVKPAATVTAG